MLAREAHTFRRKPVHMTRRFADFSGFPTGLQQLAFGHAYEDGIQGPGLQSCVSADVVSIFPVLWTIEKRAEHLNGLRRQSHKGFHS